MKKKVFSQKLIGGEAYFTGWRIVARVVGIGNTFLILSSLTVYQYGVLQLLLSLYTIVTEFSSPAGGAIGNDIQRLVGAGDEARAKRLFFENTLARAIIAVLLFVVFLAGARTLSAYYKPDFIVFFRIIAFFFITEFILTTAHALLTIRLAFKQVASRVTVRKIVQFGILLVLFLTGSLGIGGILISMAGASLATSLFLAPHLIRSYEPWRRVSMTRERILTRVIAAHGKWEVARTAFHGVASNAHPWVIKLFLGTEAVGIYNAALSLTDVCKEFIASRTLGTLLAHVSSERERMRLIFTHGTKYLAALGSVVAVLGAIGGTIGVRLFFPDYVPALPLFYILVAIMPLHAMKNVGDSFLLVLRAQKFVFFRSFGRDVLKLALIIVLLPRMGLPALPLTELLIALLLLVGSYRYLAKRSPDLRLNARNFFHYTREDAHMFAFFRHTTARMIKMKWQQIRPPF